MLEKRSVYDVHILIQTLFLALSSILTYTGEAQTGGHLIYKTSLVSVSSSWLLFSEVWIMAVREETTELKGADKYQQRCNHLKSQNYR